MSRENKPWAGAGSDTGSALAIALVFLMLFGVFVGVVLQFAATGQRTTLVVRDEAMRTYAGGGALDGAINQVRTTLTTGTAPAGPSTCFTLPSGLLDNPSAVTVTCQPRAGSGADLGGGTASQPDQAVLALSSVGLMVGGVGVIVAVLATLFAAKNWRDVTIDLWGNLEADIKIPILILLVFLVGFLPTWLIYRTKLWRVKNRVTIPQRDLEERNEAIGEDAR